MKLLSKQLLIDFKNNHFDLGKIDKNYEHWNCAQLRFNKMVMHCFMFLGITNIRIVHNCGSTKWLCIGICSLEITNRELCTIAVQQNGMHCIMFPKIETLELCTIAVQQNGMHWIMFLKI